MPNFALARVAQEAPDRLTEISIYLSIPDHYHQEPILSHLATHYHLQVNILAAILGKSGKGNGQFHLSLRGTSSNLRDALIYLEELNITLIEDQERDGW